MNQTGDEAPNAVAKHYTILVYKFRHVLDDSERRDRRLEDLYQRWWPWWHRLLDDQDALKKALDDSYFLLPHVRRLLQPESLLVPQGEVSNMLEGARKVAELPIRSFPNRLLKSGVTNSIFRMTLDDAYLKPVEKLQFKTPETSREKSIVVDVDTDWIDGVICPQGIGFLLWKIAISQSDDSQSDDSQSDDSQSDDSQSDDSQSDDSQSDDSQSDDSNSDDSQSDDFDHRYLGNILGWMRSLHPPRLGYSLPKWSDRNHPDAEFESRDLVDFLLQGLTTVEGKPDKKFSDFRKNLNRDERALYTARPDGQTYGQVFHQYSFASLRFDEQQPNGEQPDANELPAEEDPFGNRPSRWIYELATCTDTSRASFDPHPSQAEHLQEYFGISLWKNWQGMALRDNVVFVAFLSKTGETPEAYMVEEVLPHNIQGDYLYLYLLALYQRFWLNVTFGELIRKETDVDQNWPTVRKIWERFVQFENCYLYSEVSGRPQGNYLYALFQRSLGVPALYDELKDQMKTLHDHYDSLVSRQADSVLYLLAVVGLPIGVATSIYGSKLIDDPLNSVPSFLGMLVVLIVIALAFVMSWRSYAKKNL